MTTPNARTLLTYANVQMAAEARNLTSGMTQADLEAALKLGNNRSSVFTSVQAAAFALEWKVVDHRADTNTGFSGTLFQYIGGDDPARGLTNGQFVIDRKSVV